MLSTDPQPTLADFREWIPDGSRQPCHAPAGLVLVRPSGHTLRFICTTHAPAWAGRIHGAYRVLERAEWEAGGAGYRGKELGGRPVLAALPDEGRAGRGGGGRYGRINGVSQGFPKIFAESLITEV
jgi:hypothetical protein